MLAIVHEQLMEGQCGYGDYRTIAANKTAQPNIVTAIASSDFYALNQLIGTRLAEYLPDHIGLDRFKNNYTQVRPQGPFCNHLSQAWSSLLPTSPSAYCVPQFC